MKTYWDIQDMYVINVLFQLIVLVKHDSTIGTLVMIVGMITVQMIFQRQHL